MGQDQSSSANSSRRNPHSHKHTPSKPRPTSLKPPPHISDRSRGKRSISVVERRLSWNIPEGEAIRTSEPDEGIVTVVSGPSEELDPALVKLNQTYRFEPFYKPQDTSFRLSGFWSFASKTSDDEFFDSDPIFEMLHLYQMHLQRCSEELCGHQDSLARDIQHVDDIAAKTTHTINDCIQRTAIDTGELSIVSKIADQVEQTQHTLADIFQNLRRLEALLPSEHHLNSKKAYQRWPKLHQLCQQQSVAESIPVLSLHRGRSDQPSSYLTIDHVVWAQQYEQNMRMPTTSHSTLLGTTLTTTATTPFKATGPHPNASEKLREIAVRTSPNRRQPQQLKQSPQSQPHQRQQLQQQSHATSEDRSLHPEAIRRRIVDVDTMLALADLADSEDKREGRRGLSSQLDIKRRNRWRKGKSRVVSGTYAGEEERAKSGGSKGVG
ncbi:uncharacterized protein VTP21DRAFT_5263 [Calcarisporiella thermophila]|uniref:uncharacterized protein n=1 Tax=Calcarisporiella thermophila TaxID=911321 RepID=UPI00374259B5